jgi:hypothetical protein
LLSIDLRAGFQSGRILLHIATLIAFAVQWLISLHDQSTDMDLVCPAGP